MKKFNIRASIDFADTYEVEAETLEEAYDMVYEGLMCDSMDLFADLLELEESK